MAGRLVQPASASFIHWLSISGQLCTGSWARETAKKEPSTSDACGARPPCVVRSQREANKDKDHPATKTENCPRKRGRSSRRWLSRLVCTCVCVDWRTYTIALRLSRSSGNISALMIALLGGYAGCQHEQSSQLGDRLHPLGAG